MPMDSNLPAFNNNLLLQPKPFEVPPYNQTPAVSSPNDNLQMSNWNLPPITDPIPQAQPLQSLTPNLDEANTNFGLTGMNNGIIQPVSAAGGIDEILSSTNYNSTNFTTLNNIQSKSFSKRKF